MKKANNFQNIAAHYLIPFLKEAAILVYAHGCNCGHKV